MGAASPTGPPLSVPSAITAAAPARSARRARAGPATTGMTLLPASFQAGMYWPGLPAPVVMTAICSWASSAAMFSRSGFISMTLTPKGRSVRLRQISISLFSRWASQPPEPMTPSAPALETAAANAPVAILAIPPWMMGNSTPKNSFSFIFAIAIRLLSPLY